MQELLVTEVIPREKGRTSIRFDNGMEVLLYKGEVRKLGLQEQTVISREKYDEIMNCLSMMEHFECNRLR